MQDRDSAPEHPGEGAGGKETVGGRRRCGTEARGRTGGARPRAGPGDRPETQGNQRLHRPLSPVGGGADLRLAVEVSAPCEGRGENPGKLLGLGPAGRMPVPDATCRAGDNAINYNNIIESMNYDSTSKG